MKMNGKKLFLTLITALLLTASVFADTTYKVEKGDTLYSISKKYQITVAELRAANNLSEDAVIKIGQKLTIPKADITNAVALASAPAKNTESTQTTTTYTVEKGDTLYGIAKKNGMTLAELTALNGFDSSVVIKAGQKIKIKADSKTAGTTASGSKNSDSKTAAAGKTDTTKTAKIDQTAKNAENNDSKSNALAEEKAPDTRTYGVTTDSDSTTVWPVKNPKVTTVKGKVSGVQLSAQVNEAVTCIREGTVMYVGTYRGFGQVLFVQSKTGVIYAYTGLGSTKVKKGDYVLSGAELGTAGVDSISNKPGITFMVFQNGQPIDPKTAPRN